jgi:hypothetical protein
MDLSPYAHGAVGPIWPAADHAKIWNSGFSDRLVVR